MEKKNQSFVTELTKKINFISPSTNQIISIGTGLIPFVEHDDANRALMGSNMQRQALPLLKKEIALIETGIEIQIAKESQSTLIAKTSGKIKFVSNKKIIIKEQLKTISPNINNSLLNKIKKNKRKIFVKKKIAWKKKLYFLENPRKSNQNNQMQQTSIVKKNQWVKKGQVLADGKGTFQGKLSIGRNILIGYVGWEGYNFEDAIIINERLAKEDIFTSIHVKKYKTFLKNNDDGEVRIKSYYVNRHKNLQK